jgi:hypothetical protein
MYLVSIHRSFFHKCLTISDSSSEPKCIHAKKCPPNNDDGTDADNRDVAVAVAAAAVMA